MDCGAEGAGVMLGSVEREASELGAVEALGTAEVLEAREGEALSVAPEAVA